MSRNPLYTIQVCLGRSSVRFTEIPKIDLNPIVIVDGKPAGDDALFVG